MVEQDRDQAFPIYVEAFGGSAQDLEQTRELSLTDRWVLVQDGRIDGHLRVLWAGHFLGGRAVPSGNLAAVAIAAQRRGRGLARKFLIGVLRALREQGVAMSTLYPATMAPYRSVGYEVAGVRLRYETPLENLPVVSPELYVEPFEAEDLAEVIDCYRAFARDRAGLMDRPDWWWSQRLMSVPEDARLYRYLVRDRGQVRGYVLFTHHHEQGALPDQFAPGDERSWALATRDLVWLDEAAAKALLRLARDHASMLGTRMIWSGPPSDPLLTFFRVAQPVVSSSFAWMARVIDVPAAFEARGYPAGVAVTVELRVTGDELAGGDQGYRVEIADGTANVSPAPNAEATVDIGALSAMFTGRLSGHDAKALGRLQTVDDATVTTLDAALRAHGPPWTFDFF
jgi:predicted acetyltransferase